MSTWTCKLNQEKRWTVVKERGSYRLSLASHSMGLEQVMNEKNRKKSKKRSKISDGSGSTILRESGCGQRVIAKDDSDGLYYSGTVPHSVNSSTMTVMFDNGHTQMTDSYFIIPVSGAVSRPTIQTADYVLVQVRNRHTGRICFIPGIVEMMPQRLQDQIRFYSVLLYNSQMATTLRCHLTKITKKRFEILCKFLLDKDIMKQRLRDTEPHYLRTKSVTEIPKSSFVTRSRSYSSSSRSTQNKSRSKSSSTSQSDKLSNSSMTPNKKSKSTVKSKTRPRSRSNSPASSVYSSRSNSLIHSEPRSRSRSQSEESLPTIPVKTAHEQTDKSTDTTDIAPLVDINEGDKKRIEEQQRQLEELQTKLTQQMSLYTHKQKKLRRSMKKLKSENKDLMESQNGGMMIPKITMNDVEISTSDLDSTNFTEPNDQMQPNVPMHIRALRNSLPPLNRGTNVIARWSTEGWYYRGVIEVCHLDSSYHIRDSIGNIERIYREDVIDTSMVGQLQRIEVGDSVIAPHPKYAHSYTPAKVVRTKSHDQTYRVESYDGQEMAARRAELFPLSNRKYDYDVDYIRQCENKLIGEVVVARNDDTGCFQIGQVRQKLGCDARYIVKFAEGQTILQYAPYIYSANNKRYDLAPGDRVLALAEPDMCIYLPGRVTGVTDVCLNVTFCDKSSRCDIKNCQSFWLSEEYYRDLSEYYHQMKADT